MRNFFTTSIQYLESGMQSEIFRGEWVRFSQRGHRIYFHTNLNTEGGPDPFPGYAPV